MPEVMKYFGRSRLSSILFVACLLVITFQCGKCALRTYETLHAASIPGAYAYDHPNEHLLLEIMRTSNESKRYIKQPFPIEDMADIDQDNDGLTALEEFFLFTSDESPDSDSDGVSDYHDGCSRCYGEDLRSAVLSSAVENALGFHSGDESTTVKEKEIIYVSLSDQEAIDLRNSDFVFVGIRAREGNMIRKLKPEVNIIDTENVIFCPGLCYAYKIFLDCGLRCGWGKLVVILDIPFVGPKTIYTLNRYIE